jgi:hypothetical protein
MLLQVFKSFNPGILFAPISFRSDRLLHPPASKIVEYEPEQSLGLKAAFLAAIKDEEARRNVCYTLLGHGEVRRRTSGPVHSWLTHPEPPRDHEPQVLQG